MLPNNQKIPEGWSVKKVKDLGRVVTGSTPSMSCPENYGGTFCWATAHDFSSKYISDTVIKLSEKGKNCSRILPSGSVLITCIASLGLNAISKVEMATNQQINAIIPNKENNGEFIYYQISYNTNQLKRFAGAGGMMILTKGEFEKVPFIFPPLPEQEKIAGILGTWDEAIEKLSNLIEQKKLLKKGLMQKLLTGKTRLSGFTQPWKEVKLGEIGTTYTGLSGKNKDNFGRGSYFIPYMNIYQNNHINPQQLEQVEVDEGEKQNTVKYGDIFFTTSSETPEEVGFASVLLFKPERNIYLNSFCFGYRLNNFKSLLPEYASFLFRSIHARKIMYKLAQGATRFNLSKNELMKEKIYIPSDISEQQAIADVLSTADDEINLLNQKLEALKEQKKGLMQQLLTGQIRVKVN